MQTATNLGSRIQVNSSETAPKGRQESSLRNGQRGHASCDVPSPDTAFGRNHKLRIRSVSVSNISQLAAGVYMVPSKRQILFCGHFYVTQMVQTASTMFSQFQAPQRGGLNLQLSQSQSPVNEPVPAFGSAQHILKQLTADNTRFSFRGRSDH